MRKVDTETFSKCSANVKRNVKLFVWFELTGKSSLLCVNLAGTQMLFTYVVSKETTLQKPLLATC